MEECIIPFLFSYLTLKEVESLACTCKSFYNLILTNIVYKKRAIRFLKLSLYTYEYHTNRFAREKQLFEKKINEFKNNSPIKIFHFKH